MGETSDNAGLVLLKYVQKYNVPQGCTFTHLNLAKPGGRLYVGGDQISTFMNVYKNALDSGYDIYLAEKNRHISPVKVDFDFKFEVHTENCEKEKEDGKEGKEGKKKKKKKKQYTGKHLKTKHIEEIVSVYIQLIRDMFVIEEHQIEHLNAYITEKKGVSNSNNNKVKEGFHLMFPSIVTKASVQFVLREHAIKRLTPIFEKMECVNTPDDIVDKSIIEQNCWMMYGSKKFGKEPYLMTRIYEVYDASDDTFKLHCVKISKDHKLSDFVDLLSIRNKYDETKLKETWCEEVREFEVTQEARNRKMSIMREIIMDRVNESKNECSDIDLLQVQKLVDILDVKRVDNYEYWIRLGWLLRNIDHRLLDVWDNVSRKSSKYTEGECEIQWIKMRTNVHGLGLGTLHMWAKEDNRDAYNDIIINELRSLIRKSVSNAQLNTHTDIARVIYFLYRNRFVCSSVRYNTWYEFRNHRWHNCDKAVFLRKLISEEVWAEYMQASSEYSRKAIDTENEDERNRCQDTAKNLIIIASKLKIVSFKDSLIKECMELFYVENFEELLDMQENLIGFENGIFDLNTMEIRPGKPDDHISLSTGCDYVPYDSNHEYIKQIQDYMGQVFIKPDVRHYVLKLFSSFLHGSVRDQKFYIWTGSGSNSKSLLVEFFMKSFGEYCCVFPVTLLTSKRAGPTSANSDLALSKGKRFALMSEPSDDEKINVGLMKELSGGDKITARRLYHEPVQFEPQFKMVLLCNNIPPIDTDDGGTWRRIRVVEFASKFVDEPKADNEFPINYDLKYQMINWRPYFISLLIHYYTIYCREGMAEPLDVMKCTNEYKRSNDHMCDFVMTFIEKKEGTTFSLNDAFMELKQWIKDDNIPMKVPTKPDLQKYLNKNLANSVGKNNVQIYHGYRLKSQAEDDTTLE